MTIRRHQVLPAIVVVVKKLAAKRQILHVCLRDTTGVCGIFEEAIPDILKQRVRHPGKVRDKHTRAGCPVIVCDSDTHPSHERAIF